MRRTSKNKAAAIAQENPAAGSRAEDIAWRIANLGDITLSRARTIARLAFAMRPACERRMNQAVRFFITPTFFRVNFYS